MERVRQTSEFKSLCQTRFYDPNYLQKQLEQKQLSVKPGLHLSIYYACNFMEILPICQALTSIFSNHNPSLLAIASLPLACLIASEKRTYGANLLLQEMRDNNFDPFVDLLLMVNPLYLEADSTISNKFIARNKKPIRATVAVEILSCNTIQSQAT